MTDREVVAGEWGECFCGACRYVGRLPDGSIVDAWDTSNGHPTKMVYCMGCRDFCGEGGMVKSNAERKPGERPGKAKAARREASRPRAVVIGYIGQHSKETADSDD